MNNIRPNLKNIFEECQSRGILTSLNESCCDTCNIDSLESILKDKEGYIGYVYSHAQNVNDVMECLEEEGSALIRFGFDGKTRRKQKEVGYALASIFKKGGYEVEWNETMGRKIGVVIVPKDLPPGFQEKWQKNNKKVNEDFVEDENITKIKPVTKKMYTGIYGFTEPDNQFDDEEKDEEKDEKDKKKNMKEKKDEDTSCLTDEEEDEECLPGCICFNCKAEDEDEDENEDEDEDKDEDEDDCLPGCTCFNCEAERKEAQSNL